VILSDTLGGCMQIAIAEIKPHIKILPHPMGTGGPFPGGKARPGRDADHSPPSSAEVKYQWELYLLSPHAPPWCVAGHLYLYLLLKETQCQRSH
jgi:hypothetical protein